MLIFHQFVSSGRLIGGELRGLFYLLGDFYHEKKLGTCQYLYACFPVALWRQSMLKRLIINWLFQTRITRLIFGVFLCWGTDFLMICKVRFRKCVLTGAKSYVGDSKAVIGLADAKSFRDIQNSLNVNVSVSSSIDLF